MRKDDIETHELHNYGPRLPAINVKVYGLGPDADDVAEHFGCDEDTAQQALNYAFETQQESFWEDIGETVAEIFPDAKAYSAGRMSGWLVLDGLPDLEQWDAVMVSKFAKLERQVKSDIAWRCSRETLFEDIEANEWAKPGAERYNFVDTDNGPACIADMKAAAIAAGFAPVVRK